VHLYSIFNVQDNFSLYFLMLKKTAFANQLFLKNRKKYCMENPQTKKELPDFKRNQIALCF